MDHHTPVSNFLNPSDKRGSDCETKIVRHSGNAIGATKLTGRDHLCQGCPDNGAEDGVANAKQQHAGDNAGLAREREGAGDDCRTATEERGSLPHGIDEEAKGWYADHRHQHHTTHRDARPHLRRAHDNVRQPHLDEVLRADVVERDDAAVATHDHRRQEPEENGQLSNPFQGNRRCRLTSLFGTLEMRVEQDHSDGGDEASHRDKDTRQHRSADACGGTQQWRQVSDEDRPHACDGEVDALRSCDLGTMEPANKHHMHSHLHRLGAHANDETTPNHP
mmetsp:Transcript_11319/g.31528  ORF Transcript_11319/g.31528 Transcript_11319/m.31528 type:complete len:278 (+) Transcript_11319:291-1124(+)